MPFVFAGRKHPIDGQPGSKKASPILVAGGGGGAAASMDLLLRLGLGFAAWNSWSRLGSLLA